MICWCSRRAPLPGLVVGIVFVLVGLAFKVSAVPFHMWTPDVYEGAPTPVTVFFATAPKVAAMALLLRVMGTSFASLVGAWQILVVIVSIASMVLGAFAAIGQTNIKRLMAYSSIGHMGYALIGLAVGTAAGVRGTLVYMVIYVFMTAGTFGCIMAMRRQGKAVEQISDLSGLASNDPALALALAVFMFSLAGIPLMSGFFAKLYIFLAAVQARPVGAGDHRRADQRGGRVLLYPHHQGDVFRRAGRAVRPASGLAVVRRGGDGGVHRLLLPVPGADRGGCPGGGKRVVPVGGFSLRR